MIPQIDNSNDNNFIQNINPSKTYKLSDNRIGGFVDGKNAIQQCIYHILSVERYSCAIYDDNYGVELEQYIGKDLAYIESTIQDTLKEALTQDNRINDVIVNQIIQTDTDNVLIDFDVICNEGVINMGVNLVV